MIKTVFLGFCRWICGFCRWIWIGAYVVWTWTQLVSAYIILWHWIRHKFESSFFSPRIRANKLNVKHLWRIKVHTATAMCPCICEIVCISTRMPLNFSSIDQCCSTISKFILITQPYIRVAMPLKASFNVVFRHYI